MFTEEELYSLLEEAFEEGYNSALEEVEEVLDESYEEFDTDYPELFVENTNRKHPERGYLSRGARAMERIYGIPREKAYGNARATSKAVDDYIKDNPDVKHKKLDEFMKSIKGASYKAAADYARKNTTLNERINQAKRGDEYFNKRGIKGFKDRQAFLTKAMTKPGTKF